MGVNPDFLTLRQLQWMADGHQRAAWVHTLAVAAGFGKAMGAKGPGVFDLVPERYKEAAQKRSKEEEAAEAEFAFMGLEAGLRSFAQESR